MKYAFSTFLLDSDEYRFTRGGETVVLPPKPFDLLVALVSRAGRLVTREELLKIVWKDVVVEQSSLNAAMSVLRQSLGDEAAALIETVPGRGYRFIADVTVAEEGAPAGSPSPAAAAPYRVVIVDDHAVVRIGVRALLERQPGCSVVGEAETAPEADRVITAARPQFVVLDLMLNGQSTLAQIAGWRGVVPELRVVVLSMHDEGEWARQALAAGAHGYVMKGAMLTELRSAIDAVLRGELWVSAQVSRALLKDVIEGRPLSH